jgi:hypothetical protein
MVPHVKADLSRIRLNIILQYPYVSQMISSIIRFTIHFVTICISSGLRRRVVSSIQKLY